MQKNTIVLVMASLFVAGSMLSEATAASNPSRSHQQLLPVTASTSAARIPQSNNQHSPDPHPEMAHALPPKQFESATPLGPWLSEAKPWSNQSTSISANARDLIHAIQNAPVHGLNPDSYGLSQIMLSADALKALDRSSSLDGNQPDTVDAGRLQQSFSTRLDLAFLRLASNLGEGVVDARSTQRRLFRDPPKVDTEALLESVWSGQQGAVEALESVTPAQEDYQRLTRRMRDLLTERAAGIERPMIANSSTLSEFMRHKDVLDIRHRLMETGELSPDTRLSTYFDDELTAALKKFQRRNGLEADGAVGRRTRDALNLSINDEIRAVALSLERWRWMPRQPGHKHLYINIPDYRVEYRVGSEINMSMTAVVGEVEHQTPTFSRDMSYMEFNPTWTVPKSITNRELIPKERRQPGYLLSRQFDFLKLVGNQLVPVPPETITQADLQSEVFPYTLRQRGGGMNGLGRLKFMMPNPYSIYLHDTQAKGHFALTERAFSHGCIRLSDPDGMARLLMSEDGYSSGAIRDALQNQKTHRISLRERVPTHLTYITTWVDAQGVLQRRADVYDHDAALMSALHSSNTLLSILNPSTASLDDSSGSRHKRL